MADITVVIPTFNRGSLLAQTVEHLLLSRLGGNGEVEIVVVDDGSTSPAAEHLGALSPMPPFTLRVVRQKNAGPAAARNAGFRQARGALVVFMDDDILPRPDLLSSHVEAHRLFPRSVVFGPCGLADEPDTPLRRYFDSLHARPVAEPFTRVGIVASGQLSVERAQFETERAVYRDDLMVPCAEEFELSFRLRTKGIPIIMFARVVATHHQPVQLASIRNQQRKYGVGIAEASVKYPELASMPEFAAILAANGPLSASDSFGAAAGKVAKEALRYPPIGNLAEGALALVERFFPTSRVLQAGYRALLGTSLYAGLQEGRRQFGARP